MWKLGNGLQIKVGEDPIFGSSSFSFLSCHLVIKLRSRGIVMLGQVFYWKTLYQGLYRWKNAEALNLPIQFHAEWNCYIFGLCRTGSILTEEAQINFYGPGMLNRYF